MNIFKELDKMYNNYVQEKTVYYRDILKFAPEETTTHNNKSDAFKHIFTSATLTLFTTWFGSLLLTNKHEWNNLESGSPVDESVMDFYNNKLGRKIGLKALWWIITFRYSELKLAKEIAWWLQEDVFGRAICSLKDSGIEVYKQNPAPLFDRKCDCERFKKYLK